MSAETFKSEAQEPEEADEEQSSEELTPPEVETIYENLETSLRNTEPNSARLIAFHDFTRYLGAHDWIVRAGNAAEANPENMRLQSKLRRAEIAREIAGSDLSKGPFLYRGYADELADIRKARQSMIKEWQNSGVSLDEAEENALNDLSTLKESLSQPRTYPRGASPQNK